MDWLRDPVWTFISAVVGVGCLVASVITIYLARKQIAKKVIFWEVTQDAQFPEHNVDGDVVAAYSSGTWALALKLWNAGNAPIERKDFVRSIRFTFGRETGILSARVAKAVPQSIGAKVTFDKRQVVLSRVLLNPGYSIEIVVLLDRQPGPIHGEALISGAEIKQLPSMPRFVPISRQMLIIAPIQIDIMAVGLLLIPRVPSNLSFMVLVVGMFLFVGTPLLVAMRSPIHWKYPSRPAP